MRYNIKRLFKEHEEKKAEFDRIKAKYLDAVRYGEDDTGYTQELNRLRHSMSLDRQFIGQEVVARWRGGRNLNTEVAE